MTKALGRPYIFLPWLRTNSRTYKVRLGQLEKLAAVIRELEVTPESYIKAQFEELVPFLRKKTNHEFPPIWYFWTDNAKKRYWKHCEMVEAKYKGEKDKDKQIQRDIEGFSYLDIDKAVNRSAHRFAMRLKAVKKMIYLTEEVVQLELEFMAKGKVISNIYVYSNPLSWKNDSDFIAGLLIQVDKKLTTEQKKEIKIAREKLKLELRGDVAIYV